MGAYRFLNSFMELMDTNSWYLPEAEDIENTISDGGAVHAPPDEGQGFGAH